MDLCAARHGLRALLRAVLGAALAPLGDAAGVERGADHLVAEARQVLDAAAADEDDRVLLEVVPLAGDVGATSIWFVSRTRATLRSAEFGFFGVVVYTRVQTPRFCGAPRRAGVLVLVGGVLRPLRTS